MSTSALIDINQIVDEFLLSYKKSTEDSFIYLQHACNCVRDFKLYDSQDVITQKVSISALGIIEMPSDMVGFNGLFKPYNGEWWPFTRKDSLINTTTTTLGVEGNDSTFGEGSGVQDPKSDAYGGVGGINDYYYKIDWKARRIFCEGITSETVALKYVTTGIEISGTTYVPTFITPMIHDYLLWKECYWLPGLERYSDMREKNYNRSELKVRGFINSMTENEWHDLLLSITTQVPLR